METRNGFTTGLSETVYLNLRSSYQSPQIVVRTLEPVVPGSEISFSFLPVSGKTLHWLKG